jgi:hypothetical protein
MWKRVLERPRHWSYDTFRTDFELAGWNRIYVTQNRFSWGPIWTVSRKFIFLKLLEFYDLLTSSGTGYFEGLNYKELIGWWNFTSFYARKAAGIIENVSDVDRINRLSFVSTYILLSFEYRQYCDSLTGLVNLQNEERTAIICVCLWVVCVCLCVCVCVVCVWWWCVSVCMSVFVCVVCVSVYVCVFNFFPLINRMLHYIV